MFTGKTIGEHLGVKTVVSDVYDAFKGALQGFGIDVTPSANVDVGHEGDDTRNLFPVARLAPAIEFYGDKRTIDEGDELTLSWSVANAESCVGLDSWSGPKPFSGSLTISDLTTNSIFTLSCKSADGSYRSRSVFVVVLDPTKSVSSSAGAGGSESGGAGAQNGTTLIVPDPTLTLIAEPETVSYGESVHLVWQSENATLCSGADDWPRSQAVSPGEEKYERASGDKAIFFVTNDKLFTLICYGADGRAVQKSVTVEVVSPAVATTTATTTP